MASWLAHDRYVQYRARRDERIDLPVVVAELHQQVPAVLAAHARTPLNDAGGLAEANEESRVLEAAHRTRPRLGDQLVGARVRIIEDAPAELLVDDLDRSEERRVGKGCRSRGGAAQ